MKNSSVTITQRALSAFLFGGLLLIPAILAAQSQPSLAPAPAKSTLTIKVTGLRSAKGRINLALFRDGKGFPTDTTSSVASQRLEIDPQTLTVTAIFTNIPQGDYAISVLHDDNLSGKMEYDAQGIPQKGYGLSNNPDASQGPPTPEQGIFKVSQLEVTTEIKMLYWQ